jgi:hypothetical protein
MAARFKKLQELKRRRVSGIGPCSGIWL